MLSTSMWLFPAMSSCFGQWWSVETRMEMSHTRKEGQRIWDADNIEKWLVWVRGIGDGVSRESFKIKSISPALPVLISYSKSPWAKWIYCSEFFQFHKTNMAQVSHPSGICTGGSLESSGNTSAAKLWIFALRGIKTINSLTSLIRSSCPGSCLIWSVLASGRIVKSK